MTYRLLTQGSLQLCELGRLLRWPCRVHGYSRMHARTWKKKCLNITFRVFYYDQQLYLATFLSSIREDTLPSVKKGICQMQQLEQRNYY